MKKLFTMIIGTKQYLTTNDAVAWDVCLRFDAEIHSIGQTNRTIDGLEYQDRTIEEIYASIKRLCAPVLKGFKGKIIIGDQYDSFSKLWNDSNDEEKLDGTRLHKFYPSLIQHDQKFDEYGHLINPDVIGFIDIRPRQMGRTYKGIMSITGCDEETAKKVHAAKANGDSRNIIDIAKEFSN